MSRTLHTMKLELLVARCTMRIHHHVHWRRLGLCTILVLYKLEVISQSGLPYGKDPMPFVASNSHLRLSCYENDRFKFKSQAQIQVSTLLCRLYLEPCSTVAFFLTFMLVFSWSEVILLFISFFPTSYVFTSTFLQGSTYNPLRRMALHSLCTFLFSSPS